MVWCPEKNCIGYFSRQSNLSEQEILEKLLAIVPSNKKNRFARIFLVSIDYERIY